MFAPRATVAHALGLAAALLSSVATAEPACAAQPQEPDWCGPAVERLSDGMCHFRPPGDEAPDTLVIFLHGLTKVGTTWQHTQQQAVARFAKTNGFEAIMPRGRVGAGSKKFTDMWNWPTSMQGQKEMEESVLAEWTRARESLEAKNGKPFKHVFVFGFSAGAYYAASLALRGRVTVDGYGVFAGGGAPKHVERWAKGTQPKPPVYVGWGTKDKARRDPQKLARALRAMGWRHRAVPRPRVGHTVTDAQIREAFKYLHELSEGAKAKTAQAEAKSTATAKADAKEKN